MRARIAFLLAAGLVAAACSSPPSDTETGPTEQGDGNAAPALEAGVYAYLYAPGDSYTYAFVLTQDIAISVEAEGDQAFLAGEDAPPGDIAATVTIGGTVTYDVAPGPEPDTYTVTVTGTFDEISVKGEIDGEPVTDELGLAEAGAPELIQVPNVTLIIDSQGNVVQGEIDGEELPGFDMFQNPFSSFEDITSGGLSTHFGPAFPEEPLGAGDTWGDTYSDQVFDQTVTAESTYTVTGFETVGGATTAVIDITRSFSGVTIDFGEMLKALFEGFSGLGEESGSTDEGTADLDLRFEITLEPSEATGTAWFDPAAGLTRRFEQSTNVAMSLSFAMDDGIQQGSMLMDMRFDISLAAELLSDAN
jgi:hypothetical protein